MSAHTDSERIDALAEAINHIVLYETGARGNKFRIEYRSNIQKGKKKHGVRTDFLRMLADGLIKARAASPSRHTEATK